MIVARRRRISIKFVRKYRNKTGWPLNQMAWCNVNLLIFAALRDVAQPGSALAWGARGRWFESSHPDEGKGLIFSGFF